MIHIVDLVEVKIESVDPLFSGEHHGFHFQCSFKSS